MMAMYLAYLFIGFIVGFLVKYEIDSKLRDKRDRKKREFLQSSAKQEYNRKNDAILVSLRELKESISYQKEVQ
jgi:hypothetical protein